MRECTPRPKGKEKKNWERPERKKQHKKTPSRMLTERVNIKVSLRDVLFYHLSVDRSLSFISYITYFAQQPVFIAVQVNVPNQYGIASLFFKHVRMFCPYLVHLLNFFNLQGEQPFQIFHPVPKPANLTYQAFYLLVHRARSAFFIGYF